MSALGDMLRGYEKQIEDQQEEIRHLKNGNKSLSEKYVGLFVRHIEVLDDYFPEWRLHCNSEIKQLKELLK